MSTFERIAIYEAGSEPQNVFDKFKADWGNSNFRVSRLTFVSLFFLVIAYPGLSVGFTDDPTEMLKSLNEGTRLFLLISTIIFQWFIFLLLYGTSYREGTMLAGLGFKRIRGIDFAWAFSFLLIANLLLTGLAWVLAQIGLPMPGEISFLIPTDALGRGVWVVVAITAGVCEETAFRGYLMTRLRLMGKLQNWVIPTIVSAVVFGACHAYQGIPGFIVITTYGLMFSLLYIRTGTIWPGIIAHFFQDFGALFFPQ
jgi:membrane protease YdiL (CAAX protease family)